MNIDFDTSIDNGEVELHVRCQALLSSADSNGDLVFHIPEGVTVLSATRNGEEISGKEMLTRAFKNLAESIIIDNENALVNLAWEKATE